MVDLPICRRQHNHHAAVRQETRPRLEQTRYSWAVREELPGYRTSSARRKRVAPSSLTAAVVVVVVIFVALAILDRSRQPPPAPIQSPPPTPTSPPTKISEPTATVMVERSSEWVVASAPSATPSPWPDFAPPATATPRPQPSPTPRTAECVTFRWSARQVFRPSAQVMVEIEAVNRCNRDLGPLELWFDITGWRQGSSVQSVRGHPFDRIRRGGSGIVAIGLPGSIDWYDRIAVEIVD
jgi:hypothetical protein